MIRRLFNEGGYQARLEAGDLLASVEKSAPAHPGAGQPPGTVSEMVWYFEQTEKGLRRVVLVHQYVLPDGSIGGSGLPDPKRLLIGEEILIPEGRPPR